MKLYYSPADSGISPADQARFDSFVADYQAHGNGSIAVSAPAGINSQAMIGFFAQRINDMGVPKDHILVATHDAPDGDHAGGDQLCLLPGPYRQMRRLVGRSGLHRKTMTLPKNFGCAVQQNIAAQVADPRDLMAPRRHEDANAVRRDTVIGNYEAGKITSSDKRKSDLANEQSGTSSDVATQ